MFAVIRHYHFDKKDSAEIDRLVQEGFVPLLWRKAQGFVRYYWLDTGNGEGASFGVFKDKAGADESVRLAAEFVRTGHANTAEKPKSSRGPSKRTIEGWHPGRFTGDSLATDSQGNIDAQETMHKTRHLDAKRESAMNDTLHHNFWRRLNTRIVLLGLAVSVAGSLALGVHVGAQSGQQQQEADPAQEYIAPSKPAFHFNRMIERNRDTPFSAVWITQESTRSTRRSTWRVSGNRLRTFSKEGREGPAAHATDRSHYG